MAAPPFDINAPDPSSTGGWGAEISATRDNIINLLLFAASNGGRLPDWDSSFTYTSGKITQIDMTYQSDVSIQMRVQYQYNGTSGKLEQERYYYNKGLGAGFELLLGGTLNYAYSGDNITTVTAA